MANPVLAWASRAWNAIRSGWERTTGSRITHAGRTNAGVYINPDEALKASAVWACIYYLSTSVAKVPWRVGAEIDGGGFNLMRSHPVDRVVRSRPCPDMGSYSWRQAQLALALRYGNAYAEIVRDQRGLAAELWPIHPERVQVLRAVDGGLVYRVRATAGGGQVDLDPMDVFHIRGFGEGPIGYNVIEYAAQSIGWARATEIFGATFFGEGANPSMVVEVPGKLTAAAMEIMRDELDKLYRGPKGRRTFIADNGMKAQPVAVPPDNAQFIETRQHQVEEICRWFNVPPHKIMHLLRATFSNIEQQSIDVVGDSILPWVRILEEESEYKLFGPNNRLNLTTKLNLKGLMRGDSAARVAYYLGRWQTGSMTINDILRAEDENPIGPEGDVRFVPLNYQPLQQAIDGPPKPTVPQPGDPVPKPNGRLSNGHDVHA